MIGVQITSAIDLTLPPLHAPASLILKIADLHALAAKARYLRGENRDCQNTEKVGIKGRLRKIDTVG